MKKENKFWRSALVLLVILFFGFKDQILKNFCSCETSEGDQGNDTGNDLNLPDGDFLGAVMDQENETVQYYSDIPVADSKTAETETVNVEQYEREEDVNIIADPDEYVSGGSGGNTWTETENFELEPDNLVIQQ